MATPPLSLLIVALCALYAAAAADLRRNQVHVQSSRGDTGQVPETIRESEHPEAVTYTGYKVFRVSVKDNNTVDLLRQYEETPGVEFWTPPSSIVETVDVMVSPQVAGGLTKNLDSNGVAYRTFIGDLQNAIDEENPRPSAFYLELLEGRQGHRMTWTAYHRLSDHHQYLDFVAQEYAGLCSTFNIGTSSQGRPLKGVRCGLGDKEIWIDGGIHAREWISPAVVSYMIKDFAENSLDSKDILQKYTIYMIPITNPDGYEFSHSGDRMWRKTRSNNAGSRCVGVDPNRNFDVHWMESGSSKNPCSEVYAGPRAFSEPETRAIRDFLLSHRSKLVMYISFHSYSQMLFVPYAYTTSRPSDYGELERVARVGVAAIRGAGGPGFSIGQASNLLYRAAGGSDDWAKENAGIKYSYTFELRDRGRYGFILPAQYIEQSGKETVAGVKAMIRALR